jgi:hypothetical protein
MALVRGTTGPSVLELFLGSSLCVANYRSLAAGRWGEALCACGALYLLILDTANTAAAPFDDLHPLHAFIFWALGPGMWHHRGISCLPGASLFAAAPWLARGVRLLLAGVAAWIPTRKAAQLGPLVSTHERLGRVAAPFYVAATVDAFEALLYALAQALAAPS